MIIKLLLSTLILFRKSCPFFRGFIFLYIIRCKNTPKRCLKCDFFTFFSFCSISGLFVYQKKSVKPRNCHILSKNSKLTYTLQTPPMLSKCVWLSATHSFPPHCRPLAYNSQIYTTAHLIFVVHNTNFQLFR